MRVGEKEVGKDAHINVISHDVFSICFVTVQKML